MLLAVLILAVFAVQIGWTCRSIRRDFAERGLHVLRIRWQPWKRLLESRWSRRHMLYRVWYADLAGESHSCLVVSTTFQGFTIEEARRETYAARMGSGSERERAPAAASGDTARRRASSSPTLGVPQSPLGRLGALPWASTASAITSSIAMGLSYWSIPYRQVSLPSSLIGPALLLVPALALVVQWLQPHRWRSTIAILALAPVATVAVRIASDLASDPTSHNLFPFELAIAGFVGVVAAASGTAIGACLRRFAPAQPNG